MAKRTYPARKSRIAKGFDFQGCDSRDPNTCSCETWEQAYCYECDEEIVDGQRIIDTRVWNQHTEEWTGDLLHAACANENHE